MADEIVGFEDRCVGCLLSCMFGDALGAPVEGLRKEDIKKTFGRVTQFLHGPHMGVMKLSDDRYCCYTDDTNTILALATSLVERNGLDPAHAAKQYAIFWKTNVPSRECPPSAKRVMQAVLDGADLSTVGFINFKDGSFANGGAMRIAPIGLAFRNATPSQMLVAVQQAIISSHTHPEAVDAAYAIALSISFLLKQNLSPSSSSSSSSSSSPSCSVSSEIPIENMKVSELKNELRKKKIDFSGCIEKSELVDLLQKSSPSSSPSPSPSSSLPKLLLEHLLQHLTTEGMKQGIREILEVLDTPSLHTLKPHALGTSFQIRATEAVSCTLWLFSRFFSSPSLCIIEAVNNGGDTDTIASIVGGLLGALYGGSFLDVGLVGMLENGEFGRGYCCEIARKLAKLDLTEPLSIIKLNPPT